MLKLKLNTGSSNLAVSRDEMKTYLRLESDITEDDTLIDSLIKAAETKIENICSIAITTKTYDGYLNDLPGIVEVPVPPLQSISAITYYNDEYTGTVVDSDSYVVQTYDNIEYGEIILKKGYTWPIPDATVNRFKITFVAGFGDDYSTIPDDLKTAIKMIVAHWYDNRESQEIPPAAENLYMNYKVYLP